MPCVLAKQSLKTGFTPFLPNLLCEKVLNIVKKLFTFLYFFQFPNLVKTYYSVSHILSFKFVLILPELISRWYLRYEHQLEPHIASFVQGERFLVWSKVKKWFSTRLWWDISLEAKILKWNLCNLIWNSLVCFTLQVILVIRRLFIHSFFYSRPNINNSLHLCTFYRTRYLKYLPSKDESPWITWETCTFLQIYF